MALAQRTLESGQAFSQRQLEQVFSVQHVARKASAHDPFATLQNRELVEIVRALQTEREGLLGELTDALQVSPAHVFSVTFVLNRVVIVPPADANDG